MSGILENRLKNFGFVCVQADEAEELYFLDTGRSTTLFIEGKMELHSEYGEEFYYDFYKKTFYERHANKDTVYGEHLDAMKIVDRVSRYFENREKYLKMKDRRRNDKR